MKLFFLDKRTLWSSFGLVAFPPKFAEDSTGRREVEEGTATS